MTEWSDELNWKGTKYITPDYFGILIFIYGTVDSSKLIYAKITNFFFGIRDRKKAITFGATHTDTIFSHQKMQ